MNIDNTKQHIVKITTYKVTDGALYEDREQAIKVQQTINLRLALGKFISEYVKTEVSDYPCEVIHYIIYAIVNNYSEFRDVLNKARRSANIIEEEE